MEKSKAMKLMIERKSLIRKLKKLDPAKDGAQITSINDKVNELYREAVTLGGVSAEEAQELSMVH